MVPVSVLSVRDKPKVGDAYYAMWFAQKLSPTPDAELAFSQIRRNVSDESGDEATTILAIVDALTEGLRNGKWPIPR